MDKITTFYQGLSKFSKALSLAIVVLLGVNSASAQYCTSTATNSGDEDIYSVYLKGNTVTLNNVSSTPTCQLYTDFTSLKPVDLSAGSVYSITVVESTCNGHYTYAVNAWIDYNKNNTFESWEAVSPVSQSKGGANASFTYTWKVPCNITPGKTRMRVVMIEGAVNNPGSACGTYIWGETEDYTVDLQLPTSVSANFIAPSKSWVKCVTKFLNSNTSGYISHTWDADNDGIIEAPNSVNFNYTWNTPGTKCVKLKSTNCLGSDSIVKCLVIDTPSTVPTPDFVSNRLNIEQYESTQIFDLSSNGPYQWTWDVYDSTTYASSGYYPCLATGEVWSDPYSRGNTEFSQNPEFAFDVPGCYTVVLTATNDKGSSVPLKKVCYITVTLPTQYNLGYGTYGPNSDNVVGSTNGTIFDDGGPNLNYGNSQGLGTRSYLQITPCNAKKITLKMTRLKFKDAGDVLRVWDGKTPGGAGTTLLATWSVGAKAPQTVVATSGSMYILFESDGAGVDSGYAGSYTSELGPATLPTPSYTTNSVPSYNATPILFKNTTQNLVGVPTWEWTIDGNQVNNNTKKDFRYTFYTDGQYQVCLEIKSCVGNNKSCTTIDVVTPNSQTELDFTATNRRPKVNVENVRLIPTSDKANRFEWGIFPTTYTLVNPPANPSTYGAGFVKYNATPGDSIPTPVIKFTTAGCYTISLKAYNSLDQNATSKTIVKNKYICALDYCKPSAYILSTDVAINRVKVKDGNNELINNFTTSGVTSYTDYTASNVANLTYGKSYTLEVSRNTTVDPANRKAWIDWNIDGDFDDAGEQIMFETSASTATYTSTFTVPALSNSFEGKTVLRVAANYNNESTTPCGPITAGEYEDYGIVLANDNIRPVITLLGNDTVRVEVGTTYNDAGATAYDASEGDISSQIVTTNDLDINTTGQYTYEYNVTDKSGNKAVTVTRFVIVVTDLTKPVLTLNPGNSGCIEARKDNAPYVDPGATATDNKAPFNLTSAIVTSGSVDSRWAGSYTITYKVTDVAGNFVTKTRTVCVTDTKAPVIDTLGDARIQIGSVWFDQTVATDAYDNNVTLSKTWGFNGPVNTVIRKTYPVVYNAKDSSGNAAASVARNYRVDDFIAPVISLNTFDVVSHPVRTPYNSIPPSVSDNYYGPGQVSLVRISSNVDENVLGTYQEVFEAIDGSGNVTRRTRTVKVEDNESPRIWGEVIHGCVGENIWPMWGLSTSDNYNSPAQLKSLIEIVSQNVNPWEEGVYYITYRVTDLSGNTSEDFTRYVYYTYWPRCFNSTVSVNTQSVDETVNVYPNPTSGVVTLDLKGSMAQTAKVEVYNAMGQMVMNQNYSEAASKFEINLSGNATGVYTIKLISEGTVVTKRVVLQ
jgi:PKD repeat protein